MDIADRLAGAVWGHLVGDAVGVPYEFKDASAIGSVHFGVSGTHRQPPGTWSDDGALMLALLDSLLRDRKPGEEQFDTADQAKRFVAWADEGAYTPDRSGMFDIGGATSAALGQIRRGVPAEQAGGTGERDNGNGSLMRVLPLALVDRDSPDEVLVVRAFRASAVTHGHLVSQVACALYVLIARYLLQGLSRQAAMERADKSLAGMWFVDNMDVRMAVHKELMAWKGRSGRGYVVDSFWSAWDAFAGAKDYRGTIERAVKYGRDTDTTAAIAGGLAGIRFGLSGIPSHWLAGMRGHDLVDPLVGRLTDSPPVASGALEPPQQASVPVPPGARTSQSHPLYVKWVEPASVPASAGWTGRLGMSILAGKKAKGIAGIHWRDLEADVTRLAEVEHVDTYVLLVEDHELVATQTAAIAEVCASHGIEMVRFPVVDQGVPADRDGFAALLASVVGRLSAGETVLVTCMGGLGRTGTMVACLLREAGLGAEEAIAATRAARHGTIENSTQESFVRAWEPATPKVATPFDRYEKGGRTPLGRPKQGDLTARHGYGPPVFDQCGYACVYCGLDMAASFENWLQLSVDHVVPRQMAAVWSGAATARLVEDITNLATCCRACNDFGNRYTVSGEPPATDAAFYDLRDRVYTERRAMILAKRDQERAIFAKLPAFGPDRPAVAGEDA